MFKEAFSIVGTQQRHVVREGPVLTPEEHHFLIETVAELRSRGEPTLTLVHLHSEVGEQEGEVRESSRERR